MPDGANGAPINMAVVDVMGAIGIATPNTGEVTLLSCPDNANYQLELLAVSYVAHTLPVDGGGVTVDIEWVDDSNADTVADLKTGYDLTSGASTARVNNEIWRGKQILDPGDTVNGEFATDGSLTTPAEGAAFIVEFRIRQGGQG